VNDKTFGANVHLRGVATTRLPQAIEASETPDLFSNLIAEWTKRRCEIVILPFDVVASGGNADEVGGDSKILSTLGNDKGTGHGVRHN
jgi:hypothetical protein